MSAAKPNVVVMIDTADDGIGFDATVFEVNPDGSLDSLASFGTDPGETAADVAEQAVAHLEACAAEARRQFEAAGILKPKADGWSFKTLGPDWRAIAYEYAARLDDIGARLHARAGESTEDAATRVHAEAKNLAETKAHLDGARSAVDAYRKLRHTGETDEQCVARLAKAFTNLRAENAELLKKVRNRDAANKALCAALGTWAGTSASDHTATTHKVALRFRTPDHRETVVRYTAETEK